MLFETFYMSTAWRLLCSDIGSFSANEMITCDFRFLENVVLLKRRIGDLILEF